MRKIAIIGGTGVYSPDALGGFEEKVIKTPYGDALCKMGSLYGNQVVFITRHGAGHSVPPHKVNYRARNFCNHGSRLFKQRDESRTFCCLRPGD